MEEGNRSRDSSRGNYLLDSALQPESALRLLDSALRPESAPRAGMTEKSRGDDLAVGDDDHEIEKKIL